MSFGGTVTKSDLRYFSERIQWIFSRKGDEVTSGCDLGQNNSWVHCFHFAGAPTSSAMTKIRELWVRFVRQQHFLWEFIERGSFHLLSLSLVFLSLSISLYFSLDFFFWFSFFSYFYVLYVCVLFTLWKMNFVYVGIVVWIYSLVGVYEFLCACGLYIKGSISVYIVVCS